MRDPLYLAIEDAIARPLDDDAFELCAASLLRELFPTLVPVRGGQDAGMDAVAGFADAPPIVLVVTTGQDVLGNLRTNLKSHVEAGGKARLALFASTRHLSGRRRLNLQQAATDMGFALIQVFDRAWFVEALYREPRWRKELLGLSGDVPALSVLPPSRRRSLRLSLVGRSEELKRLRGLDGDLELIGRPGVGKTAVLRELVEEGWGLFIIDERDDRLADAIRGQRPARIILDDAHFEPERLTRLRHLRDEIGAEFGIVAVTWPGAAEDVESHLGSTLSVEIGPLTRDEILSVIDRTGVKGPMEFQRAIVDQARGRPGLAATLSLLALTGKAREVATGEALLQDTRVTYRAVLGEESASVLAVLALAGDAGLPLESVAACLGLDLARAHHVLRGLASGGTIDEAPWPANRLVVQPESLRYALVREVFSGPGSLPLETVLQSFDNPSIAVVPLVAAAYRGASLDRVLMERLVAGSRDPDAIAAYASLGEVEAAFSLSVAPDYALRIARSALQRAPRFAFRVLMELAVGDNRPRHSAPDHPMRVLADHLAAPSTSLEQRGDLLDLANVWQSEGRDPDVSLEAISLALVPGFRTTTVDPGAGTTWTIREGILPNTALTKLCELWDRAVEPIENLPCSDYGPLFDVLHSWLYPRMIGGATPNEKLHRFMRRCARAVIQRLADGLRNHRGVVSRLARVARDARFRVPIGPDKEFEVLFPPERIRDATQWRAAERRQIKAAHRLAESIMAVAPEDAVERIVAVEREAAEAGITYPRMTVAVCEYLAGHTREPAKFLNAFGRLEAQADLAMPFLTSLARARPRGWSGLMSGFLRDQRYWRAAVAVCLTEPVGRRLREDAVRLCDYSLRIYLESLIIRDQLDEDAIARLLEHPDCAVARAVAIQVGLRSVRRLPKRILRKWEDAIIRCPADDTWYAQILKPRPELLERWVEAGLARQDSTGVPYERIPSALLEAVSELAVDARRRLLGSVPAKPANPDTGEVVRSLVADDDELVEFAFATAALRSFRDDLLAGRPTDEWLPRAHIALSHGWSLEEIVAACTGGFIGWTGSEAAFWDGWVTDFKKLARGRGHRAKLLAEAGVRYYSDLRDRAAKRERHEQIYGLD